MSRRLLSALLVVGFASAAPSATVVIPTEFKEVVADATLIVRGHVTDVRGVVAPAGGIESVAAVSVDLVLKGPAEAFITVTVPGGTIGRSTTRMIGAPTLRLGQHALFFLKRDRRNAWRPVGLWMGIYPIRLSAATGAAVVNPPPVVGATADVGPVTRGDDRRRPMPVASFESLVRVVIAGQATTGRGRQ